MNFSSPLPSSMMSCSSCTPAARRGLKTSLSRADGLQPLSFIRFIVFITQYRSIALASEGWSCGAQSMVRPFSALRAACMRLRHGRRAPCSARSSASFSAVLYSAVCAIVKAGELPNASQIIQVVHECLC